MFKFFEHTPHIGQKLLHFPEKDYRFTVAVCGRRWGKSVGAGMEASVVASMENKRIWVVAPTYSGSEKVFREIWNTLYIKNQYPIKRASYKDQYLEFAWGTTVEGKSADKPETLVGEGLDLLILDEVAKIKQKSWELYLRPTLSDRKGKCIMISTPEGYNWIYDLYLRGQSNDEDWNSFKSPTWVNNVVFPEGENDSDLKEARRNHTKEAFEQEFGAEFTSFSGKVYPFDRNLDMGDFPYKPLLPTYCAIDFGYRMPAVVWFQTYMLGGFEHINIIDEFVHETNIKTHELAQIIRKKPYRVVKYFGDPSGKQVSAQSGLGDMEIFRQHGIKVNSIRDKVSRRIVDGIEHVRSFIENIDGLRFVHIDKKCLGVAEDFERYRYPEHKEGTNLRIEPIKDGRTDHSMDCVRYFFVNRFPIKNRKFKVFGR